MKIQVCSTRITNSRNSPHLEDSINPEISKKLEDLEKEIVSLNKRISLRTNQTNEIETRTSHYIPGIFSTRKIIRSFSFSIGINFGSNGDRHGRPLCMETLRLTASICATGSQFTKV